MSDRIDQLDEEKIGKVRAKVEAALKIVGEVCNLHFTIGSIKFSASGFTTKLEGKIRTFDYASEQEKHDAEERESFIKNCKDYELTPAHYGARIRGNEPGKVLVLRGINPKAKKYPINVNVEMFGVIKTTKTGGGQTVPALYKVAHATITRMDGSLNLVQPLQSLLPPPPAPPAPPLSKIKRKIIDDDDSDDKETLASLDSAATVPKKKKKKKKKKAKEESSWKEALHPSQGGTPYSTSAMGNAGGDEDSSPNEKDY